MQLKLLQNIPKYFHKGYLGAIHFVSFLSVLLVPKGGNSIFEICANIIFTGNALCLLNISYGFAKFYFFNRWQH